MKAFLFFYDIFYYILVIFWNGLNWKNNIALYTLVIAIYCLSYNDDDIQNNICVYFVVFTFAMIKILLYKPQENSVMTN